MINIIKKFFDKEAASGSDQNKKGDSRHDIRMATCALLLEMANIDGEFSEEEQKNIVSILQKNFQLSDKHTTELLEASHKELKGSIDLWQFTNLINKNYTRNEKSRIIEMIWQVVYADGKLDKHEDYLVHKLAKILRLTHKELIEAKLKIIQLSKK